MNIFIDLDGTLVDISKRHHAVYQRCVKIHGGVPLSLNSYWDKKRRNVKWSELLKDSKINPSAENRFLNDFIKYIEQQEYLAMDALFPGTKEALERLSSVHALWLVSLRRNEAHLVEQVTNLGIKKYFKEVLFGHSETVSGTLNKKAELIRSLNIFIDDSYLIGDTEADIVAAKLLGIKSIAITSGIRSAEYLSELHPDSVSTDFIKIPNLIMR